MPYQALAVEKSGFVWLQRVQFPSLHQVSIACEVLPLNELSLTAIQRVPSQGWIPGLECHVKRLLIGTVTTLIPNSLFFTGGPCCLFKRHSTHPTSTPKSTLSSLTASIFFALVS